MAHTTSSAPLVGASGHLPLRRSDTPNLIGRADTTQHSKLYEQLLQTARERSRIEINEVKLKRYESSSLKPSMPIITEGVTMNTNTLKSTVLIDLAGRSGLTTDLETNAGKSQNKVQQPESVENSTKSDEDDAARLTAEQALRDRKVFSVMGPYPSLRSSLRKRGWVERFSVTSTGDGTSTVFLPRSVLNETSKANGSQKEDSKTLVMMSHVVRSCSPTFLFSVKATDVLSRPVKTHQIINHFGKASAFTTKAGLCLNLKNSFWFDDSDPDTFYPRCYNLADANEKLQFIEDYRLTACIGFLKYFAAKCGTVSTSSSHQFSKTSPITRGQQKRKTYSGKLQRATNKTSIDPLKPAAKESNATSDISTISWRLCEGQAADSCQMRFLPSENDNTAGAIVLRELFSQAVPRMRQISIRALHLALQRCEQFLAEKEHEDIDVTDDVDVSITDDQWEQFIEVFLIFVRNKLPIDRNALLLLKKCKDLLKAVSSKWPQYEMDGFRNVWILKPGAKSRGRGIQCTDNLGEMLDTLAVNSGSTVVQKYIERPLLIYSTKFDIRQWFLVTDWNPLMIWFYNACYLRFCSKEFTLDDFHASVHISNNCIQKNFEQESERPAELPMDNMWTNCEFVDYLKKNGHGEVWKEKIVPGMKKAILSTLLCTQEIVEQRKGSFELFGADFMLTEDFHPWLLEINSSPSMARTTRATAVLVDCVLEDTVKVVLDRKANRFCETGNFELVYRQPAVGEPPPIGTPLSVDGRRFPGQTRTEISTRSL